MRIPTNNDDKRTAIKDQVLDCAYNFVNFWKIFVWARYVSVGRNKNNKIHLLLRYFTDLSNHFAASLGLESKVADRMMAEVGSVKSVKPFPFFLTHVARMSQHSINRKHAIT